MNWNIMNLFNKVNKDHSGYTRGQFKDLKFDFKKELIKDIEYFSIDLLTGTEAKYIKLSGLVKDSDSTLSIKLIGTNNIVPFIDEGQAAFEMMGVLTLMNVRNIIIKEFLKKNTYDVDLSQFKIEYKF